MFTLSQAAANSSEWFGPLLQLGGVGACLAWFMFRSEPRLRAIEAAIDRASRTMIVMTIAIANVLEALKWHSANAVRLQAEPIERELDDAAKLREAK